MKSSFEKIMPICCGKRMQIRGGTSKFLEVWCGRCDDLSLIKKAYVSVASM
jgi:phage FluMu protein Com